MTHTSYDAVVIGGGPAGLMAAETLLDAGCSVVLADAKPTFGRKFLMAGKSGLNLTKIEDPEHFTRAYDQMPTAFGAALRQMMPGDVQSWAQGLGQDTFVGSTGRLFPKSMKASPLLRAWLARLDRLGLKRRTNWRWTGWHGNDCCFVTPDGETTLRSRVTVLALGGGSWARLGSDGQWSTILREDGHEIVPFAPSNAGLAVTWSSHMSPHFGTALKNVRLSAGDQISRGEAVLSARGLEGGGIYSLTAALRTRPELVLDLAPDIPLETLQQRLATIPPKQRFAQVLRNGLRFPPIKTALIMEVCKGTPPRDDWVQVIKALRLPHDGLRPLDEAISTAGGLSWAAMDSNLMLTNRPGTFCAGEMIDWDAPTGGYLITACLATGRHAGQSAVRYLAQASATADT